MWARSCMLTMHESKPPRGDDISALANGVVKTFSQGRILALDHVDLTTRFGEITAIVGANGSGKSTLLKLFFGLGRPDAGDIRTLDLEPACGGRPLRSQVAYVSQQQALDPEMTGREMLQFFCALYGLTGVHRRKRVDALVESFGLAEVILRRASEYSGGFRQRLHLAIGLIHEPRLLLLDEPTSGLDPQGRAFFWETMRSRAEGGRSVAVVTHDLEEVTRHANRVALLKNGRVCVHGPPRDIIAEHGRTVLEITLEKPPRDWAPIRQRLELLEGVDGVTTDRRQATLDIDTRPQVESAVVAVLEDEGLEPASYRRERPSLSSAYFHLTGQALGPRERRPQGRGQGARRQ